MFQVVAQIHEIAEPLPPTEAAGGWIWLLPTALLIVLILLLAVLLLRRRRHETKLPVDVVRQYAGELESMTGTDGHIPPTEISSRVRKALQAIEPAAMHLTPRELVGRPPLSIPADLWAEIIGQLEASEHERFSVQGTSHAGGRDIASSSSKLLWQIAGKMRQEPKEPGR